MIDEEENTNTNLIDVWIRSTEIKAKREDSMSMSKKIMKLLIAFALIFSMQIQADDVNKDTFDFTELVCWDIMLLDEKERPYALTLLYGYQAGLNKKNTHTGKDVELVLNKAGELCESNPDMKALDAIAAALN
ncbi:HdeA/HdeB family chaperone [Marinicella sp. W31]|uniref:HdeA/HdeB family chaperone n=1 Tax=Marinicella sp. W31 TaxID=3023713 RepID=UPI003757B116